MRTKKNRIHVHKIMFIFPLECHLHEDRIICCVFSAESPVPDIA